MNDEERFQHIRELESAILPSIHMLGIFYLGELLQKIEELDIAADVMEANPAILGYRRALTDVTAVIKGSMESLVK